MLLFNIYRDVLYQDMHFKILNEDIWDSTTFQVVHSGFMQRFM
jgi:hypothetical protein